jgi:hypothetical protein
MAQVKDIIQAIPYAAVASSALTVEYQPFVFGGLAGSGLPESCFLLKINNFGSTIIIISYDGINDHDQVDTRTTLEVYGGQGSSQPNNSNCLWAKGQMVYIRGTAGTGAVTLCGYYQPRRI